MTTTKKMTAAEIEQLKERLRPFSIRETQPNYTYWQIKTEDLVVTAYTSGKVVFQGQDTSFLEDEKKENGTKTKQNSFPQAGSDEVGTGDYFGPVVTAACIVTEKDVPLLEKYHVTDSKAMTDETIRQAYEELKDALPCSILVVDNDKYNVVHETTNLNAIKALLHNQCYLNLQKKGYTLPELCMVDQFTPKTSFYKYIQGKETVPLQFETKAEAKYPAVAAASVLARGRFLEEMDKLDEQWGLHFQLGAGKATDKAGKEFVKTHGKENLGHVAKLHFKNTERILESNKL